MNYIDKMEELLSQGYDFGQVAENLYLNYSSAIDNDEVYKIRKSLAEAYICNINDVKLIGSSHTGYSYKNKVLKSKTNPKDYDFGIINSQVFTKFFHFVDVNEIYPDSEKELYINSILKGKLHPLHATEKLKKELADINDKIQKELRVTRHVTVCFYLSEKSFINGLVSYNKQLYTLKLKELNSQKDKIKEPENKAIRNLEKLED